MAVSGVVEKKSYADVLWVAAGGSVIEAAAKIAANGAKKIFTQASAIAKLGEIIREARTCERTVVGCYFTYVRPLDLTQAQLTAALRAAGIAVPDLTNK